MRAPMVERFGPVRMVFTMNRLIHPGSAPSHAFCTKSCVDGLTHCISADLSARIVPCQFGGKPVCSECGCIASAGLASVGDYKVAGLVSVFDIFSASEALGKRLRRKGS